MHPNDAEAAYCEVRIRYSNALALASTESCARLSHEAMAALYEHRLAALTKSNPVSPPNPIAVA